MGKFYASAHELLITKNFKKFWRKCEKYSIFETLELVAAQWGSVGWLGSKGGEAISFLALLAQSTILERTNS